MFGYRVCCHFGHATEVAMASDPACPLPSFYFAPPCMARDRPRHCPRQQIQRPRCPSCGKRFTDVLRHLNHRQSKCVSWLETVTHHQRLSSRHSEHPPDDPADPSIPEHIPNTPQFLPPSPPHHQSRTRQIEFPGAAKTYGQVKTFMDRFDDDRFSGFRVANTYYPFAGKDEWEFASFLLSSGLSMRKINNLLRLKMVIPPTSCPIRKF